MKSHETIKTKLYSYAGTGFFFFWCYLFRWFFHAVAAQAILNFRPVPPNSIVFVMVFCFSPPLPVFCFYFFTLQNGTGGQSIVFALKDRKKKKKSDRLIIVYSDYYNLYWFFFFFLSIVFVSQFRRRPRRFGRTEFNDCPPTPGVIAPNRTTASNRKPRSFFRFSVFFFL